ncbi:uncharacterized protein ACB058_015558 [Synchiropus picturatus]
MDPTTRVVGLDSQGNMVFTMVKPVMSIFQVSADQSGSVTPEGVNLQPLAETTHVLSQAPGQVQVEMQQLQPHIQTHLHILPPETTEEVVQQQEPPPDVNASAQASALMPFAEVSSLLDPNMKGSKARKYLISYDEIKRRLQAPEKMSLRSLAAYTRVSRGPASKKTLMESLNVLGLTPSTTTSVSSSFSKLTEGDTKALCDDMKDFSNDYVDYGNMAKQLIPDTNTVQHWSKIIETKNHLEDMRKCFKDPANSGAFDNVTHGLGLGMLDVALDMVVTVIEQQIRILSGAAASEPADPGLSTRRIRRRNRKLRGSNSDRPDKLTGGLKDQCKVIAKNKRRSRKKPAQETAEAPAETCRQEEVLTLVSVGYETVSGGLPSA